MIKIRFIFIFCIIALLASTQAAWSKSEWQVLNTVKLEKKPEDMIVSADKSRIYILTEEGQLLIYSANGQHKDTIEVGRDIDQIKAGPSSDTLYLLNRKRATIQVVRVSIIETIDTKNAPIKGVADADVTVVVFSDFQ